MKLSYGFAGAAIGLAALATLFRPHPSVPAGTGLAVATGSSATFDKPLRASRSRHPRGSRTAAAGSAAVVVYVTGEVVHPGLYRFVEGNRVDDAVRTAGGFTPRADRLTTDLAEPLRDGEEVLVAPSGALDPYVTSGLRNARASRSSGRTALARRGSRGAGRSRKPLPVAPVDLNEADEAALVTLPGIGPGLAARIVAFRELNGPFGSLDDLLDVAGMSEHKLDAIDAYVAIERPRNGSSAKASGGVLQGH